MLKAVFETTGQALHVSFLVMSVDARQASPLRNMLIQAMSQCSDLTNKQRQWLDQLIGEASGSVNFSGLTGDEIRAQCAMVTQIVRDHLPAPEMHIIHAKYIPTAEEEVGRKEDGTPIKRFYYSQERVDAVMALASYWRQSPLFASVPVRALDMLIARAFVNHTKIEISYRELAANFGGSHMAYSRAYKKLRDHLKELEQQAIQRLAPFFIETGLVEGNVTL